MLFERPAAPAFVRYWTKAHNPKLLRFLLDNHYLETLEVHRISGSDMIDKFGYLPC